jgi:hypothetical protein
MFIASTVEPNQRQSDRTAGFPFLFSPHDNCRNARDFKELRRHRNDVVTAVDAPNLDKAGNGC